MYFWNHDKKGAIFSCCNILYMLGYGKVGLGKALLLLDVDIAMSVPVFSHQYSLAMVMVHVSHASKYSFVAWISNF